VTSSRAIHGEFAPLVPRVLRWLGGGRIYAVEQLGAPKCWCGVPEHHDAIRTCHILDAGGHIDYLHESDDRLLRGLSVRVQKCRPAWSASWPWNTFTLRTRGRRDVDVELEHLQRAMSSPDEALLRPAYHIQAYLAEDGTVDSIGMVRVVDLVRHMTVTPIGTPTPLSRPVAGHNAFKAASWADLQRLGVPVKSWIRDQPEMESP
jgi:hypothetical protein